MHLFLVMICEETRAKSMNFTKEVGVAATWIFLLMPVIFQGKTDCIAYLIFSQVKTRTALSFFIGSELLYEVVSHCLPHQCHFIVTHIGFQLTAPAS